MKVIEIIDRKYPDESIVQFNAVNNTSADISVNLFELGLNSVPTQDSTNIVPPNNPFTSTFALITSSRVSVVNPNTGYIYFGDNIGDQIYVRDSNFNAITTIPTGAGSNPILSLVFCPTNNYIYVGDFALSRVYVIDTATDTLLTTIITTGACRSLVYVPSTNEVWVSTVNFAQPINIIDASTNTTLPVPVFPASQPQDFAYDSVNDWVFISSTTSNSIWRVDASTKTLLANIPTPQPSPIGIGIANNNLYVGYGNIASTSFDVYDISTLSFTTNVNYGGTGSPIYQNNFLYVSAFGLVYTYLADNRIIVIDPNTNTIVNQLTGILGGVLFQSVFYNPFDNRLWGQINDHFFYWSSTFVQTPFYISGSNNYNTFVQNLEYEPMQVYYIRFISNQSQLSKVVQILSFDANGNSRQVPHFPILGVSEWQEQNNIGYVDFEGKLYLDGRTYLSNYVLSANEVVTLEIHYAQLDRKAIKTLFTNLLPKKNPLKSKFDDYIEM